eukprot:Hpha_TRINITY_DN11504_c0_g1::TRINITY_DN11504_c0_g1_i1::g.32404::m.32404
MEDAQFLVIPDLTPDNKGSRRVDPSAGVGRRNSFTESAVSLTESLTFLDPDGGEKAFFEGGNRPSNLPRAAADFCERGLLKMSELFVEIGTRPEEQDSQLDQLWTSIREAINGRVSDLERKKKKTADAVAGLRGKFEGLSRQLGDKGGGLVVSGATSLVDQHIDISAAVAELEERRADRIASINRLLQFESELLRTLPPATPPFAIDPDLTSAPDLSEGMLQRVRGHCSNLQRLRLEELTREGVRLQDACSVEWSKLGIDETHSARAGFFEGLPQAETELP